jgi:hypothetical protein
MKSIANQYKDLKEGKMTQSNFMRNLRMSMPQYITNVTSFKDAVRILKNKSILTEMYDGPSEPMGDEAYGDYRTKVSEELETIAIEEYNLDAAEIEQMFESEWHSGINDEDIEKAFDEGIEASVMADRIIEKYINMDDSMFDDTIQRLKDEESGKYTTGDQYRDDITEAKKKKVKEPKQSLHPNQIHPSELRMGIRVEMEHTDDPKKAEKIALDHLAENPYYYTALKLSGIESPSAPKAKAPVAAKKIKKKDATEMTDPVNQMQKVKLKETLERLIREELRKF